MKIIISIKKMYTFSQKMHLKGKRIGFVPTMGYLHAGHLSLIKKAREENDVVVVSIFVNPLQFGPKEDFKMYPRNLKRDIDLAQNAGTDVIFYPSTQQMYRKDFKTYVLVSDLSERLCGKFRPGHFKGVTTVVNKLFNVVQPDVAYFGRKDAQQAIIIKKMVQDLNLPLKIKVMPIVREKDGLAMSSRNVYLNPQQRKNASIIYTALKEAEKLVKEQVRDSLRISSEVKKIIAPKVDRIDYIEIVDLKNLLPVKIIKEPVLLAVAVWLGKCRLIDNTILKPH